MSQTVTQNSALSQDWVKCTVCTHPWPRLHARWALGRQCHGAPDGVSWPPLDHIVGLWQHASAVSQAVLCAMSRPGPHRVVVTARPCRKPARSCHGPARPYCRVVSWPVSRHTQQSGRPPITIRPFVSRHNPQRLGLPPITIQTIVS